MPAFRTRTRVVEAFRWVGQPRVEWPEWAAPELLQESGSALYAYTKNGPLRVHRGDWCVLGDKEITPYPDELFSGWYEPLPEACDVTPAEVGYGA